MTTQQIANRLAELCRKGEFETAQKELYAKDCLSVEQMESPDFKKEERGLEAIFAKGEKFASMTENVHGIKVSEPLIAGSAFAFTLDMDITMKGRPRMNMAELCVYETKDGKVIAERFFM